MKKRCKWKVTTFSVVNQATLKQRFPLASLQYLKYRVKSLREAIDPSLRTYVPFNKKLYSNCIAEQQQPRNPLLARYSSSQVSGLYLSQTCLCTNYFHEPLTQLPLEHRLIF